MYNRKHNRLKNFDYAQNGCYFITVCTRGRVPILAEIKKSSECVGEDIILHNSVILTEVGEVVDFAIRQIPKHYDGVLVDKYVVMPNHIHLLLCLSGDRRMISASTIVGSMKRYVSKTIGTSIWQRSFYDHIVRDDTDYQVRWQYIDNNPAKWEEDKLYCN